MAFSNLVTTTTASKKWLTRTQNVRNNKVKQQKKWEQNPMPMWTTPKDGRQLPLAVPQQLRSVASPVARLIQVLKFNQTGKMPDFNMIRKSVETYGRKPQRTLSTSAKGPKITLTESKPTTPFHSTPSVSENNRATLATPFTSTEEARRPAITANVRESTEPAALKTLRERLASVGDDEDVQRGIIASHFREYYKSKN